MFTTGILQSAFWHRFALTAHSPVGLEPEKYGVKKITEAAGSFANNDVEYTEQTGADHDSFGFGLKKSLLNYMHGACLDYPLQKWFDFKVPITTVPKDYIRLQIEEPEYQPSPQNAKVIWLGGIPAQNRFMKSKKGAQ